MKLEQPIAIDDTLIIAKLRKIVQMQPYGAAERQRLILSLLVLSFFFKLDYVLKFNRGFYRCEGLIRCRNQISTITDTISCMFSAAMEFITNLGSIATFKGA